MPWLINQTLPLEAGKTLERYTGNLAEQFDDPTLERNTIVREALAQLIHGSSFAELSERAPMTAFALDARNITFEAEYYVATDQSKFQNVKPLLWYWKCLDQTPLGQSIDSGLKIRRMIAERVFARCGKNIKVFQNVEVSVGYNIEAGDNVAIHRNVLIDDIGGVILHDAASLSDFVNVYSHTHDILESPDVTLRQTVIGKGVRVAYHATVLAGSILSDDSMMGAFALATRDFEPHVIGLGIPAKPRVWKERAGDPRFGNISVDSRTYQKKPDIRANPDFVETLKKEER
jgi:acetyltransferase-like isoleucine patch superfamily enzyme